MTTQIQEQDEISGEVDEKTREQGVQFASVVRELIKEETALVNTRINWIIILQGFLFAAFSNLLAQWELPVLLSLIGILSSLSMTISVKFSKRAIADILNKWDVFLNNNRVHYSQFPPVWGGGNVETTKIDTFLAPYHFLPNLFMYTWIVILAYLMAKMICK